VLNGLGSARESTRQVILKAAREVAYYPDLHARSLRTRRGHSIGYIIPDITNAFYGTVGITIERVFRERGYGLIVSFTEESADKEIESLKQFLSHRVAGIVLASVGTTGKFLREEVLPRQIPVVVIDNRVAGLETNLVLHDNVRGAFELTQHLLEHGHTRVACVSGPLEETSGSERLEGYRQALRARGLPRLPELERTADWRPQGGYRAVKELMGARQPPTAVFLGNSVMALGAYRAVHELALRVPEDVALAAYDNLDFVEALNPPLTTLDNAEHRIGEIAARILLERIEDGDTARVETHRVQGQLILRASCGCEPS
jgi:LacI family transcriptional regulator